MGMGKYTWTNKQRRISRENAARTADLFAAMALDENRSPQEREMFRKVVRGVKKSHEETDDRWLFQSKSSSRNYSPVVPLSADVLQAASQSQQHKFCTSCGEQLSGEDKFCGSCGTEA